MATMTPATAGGSPYRVPPEPSRIPSMVLAALVHAGLLLFLWAGISWQNTEPVAVTAEVWDMKTESAAPPPPPQVKPQPVEPPKPVERPVERPVVKPVEPPPVPKTPDIALERDKKLKEQKLKQQMEDKLAAEKLEKKKLEKKLADEKAAEAKELAEQKEKEKAEKLAKAKAEAAEQKKLDKIREAEVRRLTGAGGAGEAAKATAPRIDTGYIASIRTKIQNNTSYAGSTEVPDNPRAVFRIEQLPTGEIISSRKIKSSGVPAFDDAVEKGIIKSSPLPKKKDGTVERSVEIGFSMKDLN